MKFGVHASGEEKHRSMTCQRDRSRRLGGAILRKTMMLASLGGALAPSVGSIAVMRAQQPAAAPLVFDGVTVIDVQQGRRIPTQRVVIVGNRIRAIGSVRTVRLPAGARVVDARGKYLIPGLWDLHVHAADWDGRYRDGYYLLGITNGITGFRDAGGPTPLELLRRMHQEILAGTRVGPPRQLLSGLALDQTQPCTRGTLTLLTRGCVADSADARHVVDSLKAAGANIIKTYNLGRGLYFVVAAEARRIGIPFGGHLKEVSAIEASDSGAGIVDHLTFVSDKSILQAAGPQWRKRSEHCWGPGATVAQCQLVADHFRRNGTWLVPTIIAQSNGDWRSTPIGAGYTKRIKENEAGTPSHGNWLRDAARSGTPPRLGEHGDLKIIRRVGLPLLAGTDGTVEGFTLHVELALYVAYGLTPLEALQAATLNPAKFLHATDSLGTVAPGKLADLVLLDADPLADITNTTTIRAVVANGRYFNRAALDQLVADAHEIAAKLDR